MNNATQYIVRSSLGSRIESNNWRKGDHEYPNFRWARRTARELAKHGGVVSIWFLDRAPACRGFYRERLVVCYLVNGLGEMVTLHPPKDSFKYANRAGMLTNPKQPFGGVEITGPVVYDEFKKIERRNPATLAQYGDPR